MFPNKQSSMTQNLRRFDKTQRQMAWENYTRLMSAVLKAYPTQVADDVTVLLVAKDYVGLLELADSYGGAVAATARDKFLASQLSALIKKYPFPANELKKQARETATRKFLASEKRCQRYNLKFGRFGMNRPDRHAAVLNRMATWIAHVIGIQPDLGAIYAECGFGPGASLGVHGQNTSLARKFLAKDWSCTPSALPYARAALAHNFHVWDLLRPAGKDYVCWDIDHFNNEVTRKARLVQNNNIVFVPKTTMEERTIAVEPLLNGYIQKGVDVFMRRRLLRVGIDLRKDQDRNSHMAYLGSIPGQADPFITIDLSSASDSISSEVVKRLLPPEWYDLLNAIRSKQYKLNGTVHQYHKFTSMGNGFCFPLETLIFASACSVYSKPEDLTVYGDDIIVRQSVAAKVLKVLWQCGFRHNIRKTFLQGPFRESCGADWFEGLDVRPLTLDYALDSFENIVKFHNMSLRKPNWFGVFEQARDVLFEMVPRHVRLCRPYMGNEYGAFEVPLDICMTSPLLRWNRKIRAWSWLEVSLVAVPDEGLYEHERFPAVLMMGAIQGAAEDCPFPKRRMTRRTVRRMSHAGAISTWLPDPPV